MNSTSPAWRRPSSRQAAVGIGPVEEHRGDDERLVLARASCRRPRRRRPSDTASGPIASAGRRGGSGRASARNVACRRGSTRRIAAVSPSAEIRIRPSASWASAIADGGRWASCASSACSRKNSVRPGISSRTSGYAPRRITALAAASTSGLASSDEPIRIVSPRSTLQAVIHQQVRPSGDHVVAEQVCTPRHQKTTVGVATSQINSTASRLQPARMSRVAARPPVERNPRCCRSRRPRAGPARSLDAGAAESRKSSVSGCGASMYVGTGTFPRKERSHAHRFQTADDHARAMDLVRDPGGRRGPAARRERPGLRGPRIPKKSDSRISRILLSRRDAPEGGRDLPRRRRTRGSRAGHAGDRRGRGLHLVRLQVVGPQAGARRRGLFPAVHDHGSPDAWASDQELAFAGPGGQAGRGASSRRTSRRWPSASAAKPRQVPIVFAGYGITAKDESLKLDYDDYAGVDVKNKAVLIIRREPQDDDAKSPFDGRRTTRFATFQHKATNAFQHGAAAVLLVNDRAEVKGEEGRRS